MAHIIRAIRTAKGLVPDGFPILVDTKMKPYEAFNQYLFATCVVRGRAMSMQTARTYSEHLHDFICTCEQNGWDWKEVTELQLVAYRGRMHGQNSPHTGRSYALSSINQRLGTICRFYEWANGKGMTLGVPPTVERVTMVGGTRATNRLAHVDQHSGTRLGRSLSLRTHINTPKAIPHSELQRLFSGPGRTILIGKVAATCGSRRAEIAALSTDQIPTHSPRRAFLEVKLVTTKGNKPRNIEIPLKVVDELIEYITTERAAIVARCRAVDRSYRESKHVFLTEFGRPLAPQRITKDWNKLCRSRGMSFRFHDLRHTYAINVLRLFQQQVSKGYDFNPLKALQVRLGHASIVTTERYLRSLEVDEPALTQVVTAMADKFLAKEVA